MPGRSGRSIFSAEDRTSAKFRANLRRRAKRLGEEGAVALWRVDGGEAVDAAVEEFLALEHRPGHRPVDEVRRGATPVTARAWRRPSPSAT